VSSAGIHARRETRALEAAGWVMGDAEDFLELTVEERQLVELRVAVSRAVRALRERQNLTQTQVARKLKTSQPRIAKLESGASDVSLDINVPRAVRLGRYDQRSPDHAIDTPWLRCARDWGHGCLLSLLVGNTQFILGPAGEGPSRRRVAFARFRTPLCVSRGVCDGSVTSRDSAHTVGRGQEMSIRHISF
jgi:predicted XRE-type DNA-binding protein